MSRVPAPPERRTLSIPASRGASEEPIVDHSNPLDEALRYLARISRSRAVALVSLDDGPSLVAASGPLPEEIHPNLSRALLETPEPVWTAPLAMVPIPARHSVLLLAGDESWAWPRTTRNAVTAFLPVIASLLGGEERFRELADATSLMIWTSDASGAVTFQNRPLLAFTALTGEAGIDELWTARAHPDDRERVQSAVAEACERKTRMSLEGRFRRHDGEYRLLRIDAAPRHDGDGAFLGFDGTGVDLTGREQRRDQERQMVSLGHLAATVAHEMNNVLMTIRPFADSIRLAPPAAVLQRAADHISRAVQRGRRITHEILRFASPSDPIVEPLDAEAWFESIAEELRTVLGPGIALEIDVAGPARMLVDGHQMTQVVMNLATNARDAMAGHGTFTISSRVAPSWPGLSLHEGPFLHLILADTGPGIAEDALQRLFEPLFTTKTNGTGLGLPIVRDVVRRHRGEVLVESPPGGGAAFHLILPATDAQVAPLPRRILLIEDDETVALGLRSLLEMEGAEVAVLTRGMQALDTIARFRPAVVLLDVGLPDVPGDVVFTRIRAAFPDLPVLISTGHQLPNDELRGPTACLRKPYDLATLLATIRRLT